MRMGMKNLTFSFDRVTSSTQTVPGLSNLTFSATTSGCARFVINLLLEQLIQPDASLLPACELPEIVSLAFG